MADKEATQNQEAGVSNEQTNAVAGEGHVQTEQKEGQAVVNPHASKIEELAAKRSAEFHEDLYAGQQEGQTPEDLGLTDHEPMHDPEPESPPIPEEFANNELSDYIVMQEGQPFIKLKVDGEEVLEPFNKALQQIQKGTAADVRLQEATELARNLKDREATVTANEQALMERMQEQLQNQSSPSNSSATDVDDQTLVAKAQGVVEEMFSDEEKAAEKLVEFVKDIVPTEQPRQEVDTQALIDQAATRVREEIIAEEQKLDNVDAMNSFKANYPDVFANEGLYADVNSISEIVHHQNPDWTVRQVLEETGKRAEKLNLTNARVNTAPNESTGIPASENIDRKQRKDGLVPMPQTASGSQQPQAVPSRQQSALDALKEMRRVRGQPN